MKTLRIIAMVLVAVFWLVGSAVHVWMAYDATATATQDSSATANVRVEIPETTQTPATEPTTEPTPATRVLLVDASGSMASNIFASAGYDVVVPFSDYLGQKSGDSHIATNIALVLSLGVKELGVVTDLESYPFEELDSLEGRRFEGVQLTIFLPEEVEESYVQAYTEAFVNALDYETSSLVFVRFDGTKDVIFNNYGLESETEPAPATAPATEAADSGVVVTIDTNTTVPQHDGCVSRWEAILGSLIYFTVVMALVEVILALCGRCCAPVAPAPTPAEPAVPTDIQEALESDVVALDGSSSCEEIYQKFCQYCEKQGIRKVCRFADTVEELSLEDAKAYPAGGQTAGYATVKKAYENGAKTLTVISDLFFNDKEEITGITFDKIIFVVPAENYSQHMVDWLVPHCKSHKVIHL